VVVVGDMLEVQRENAYSEILMKEQAGSPLPWPIIEDGKTEEETCRIAFLSLWKQERRVNRSAEESSFVFTSVSGRKKAACRGLTFSTCGFLDYADYLITVFLSRSLYVITLGISPKASFLHFLISISLPMNAFWEA